jgi:hypothetical protein
MTSSAQSEAACGVLSIRRKDKAWQGLLLSPLKVDLGGIRIAEIENGDIFHLRLTPGSYLVSAYNEMSLGIKASTTIAIQPGHQVQALVGMEGFLKRMVYQYYYARISEYRSPKGVDTSGAMDRTDIRPGGYHSSLDFD